VQTCTLRDLVAEGAAAGIETDPDVALLKSSADLVGAIEAAVRFYEEPPTKAMTVETPWSEIRLSADDWAEAFQAPDPGTPHNDARELIWAELLTILTDKYDGDASADLFRKSLLQNRELLTAVNRAWPLLEAADLVADLWSVPAYLRKCAPWLSPDDVQALQRGDAQAWTVCDLPLLDAARQRLGDPEASRRRRRQEATVAAEREHMTRVVDDLVAADDSELLVMSMLRGQDLRDALGRRVRTAQRRPGPARRPVRAHRRGRGPGTDRRGVADGAAALPVPELHHRRGPCPGPARVRGVVLSPPPWRRLRPWPNSCIRVPPCPSVLPTPWPPTLVLEGWKADGAARSVMGAAVPE
jgi:hypothetical protein